MESTRFVTMRTRLTAAQMAEYKPVDEDDEETDDFPDLRDYIRLRAHEQRIFDSTEGDSSVDEVEVQGTDDEDQGQSDLPPTTGGNDLISEADDHGDSNDLGGEDPPTPPSRYKAAKNAQQRKRKPKLYEIDDSEPETAGDTYVSDAYMAPGDSLEELSEGELRHLSSAQGGWAGQGAWDSSY
ncbi:hypothetical protein OQA88_4465 [Cercophora sp. LCS_1]